MVEVIPEDTVMYIAKEPEVLLNKVESDYKKNISNAKDGLKGYLETRYEEKSAIFKGYVNIIEKMKYIIDNAEKEVFINTDVELDVFEDMEGYNKSSVPKRPKIHITIEEVKKRI